MTLYFICAISIVINVLLIWYIRKLLQKLSFFSEDIVEMNNNLESFATHLTGLHSLETYYGDETLQNLIDHSKLVVEEVHQFKDLYLVGDVEQGLEEDAEEETQEVE